MTDQNIQYYRIFNEVARVGNFTHAARNLYISQPAISNAITNLENSLGVKLFIRNSRGVQLTEKGELFYKHVKSAFSILEKGEYQLKQTGEMKIGRLNIGLSTTMCHFVMRPFLKKFIEEHPYIDISLLNQSSYQTFDMLEEHALDIGITTEPMKKHLFNYYSFMKYEYTFVATPAYIQNLQMRGADTIADYFAIGTMMILPKRHPLRQSIDQYFFESSLTIGNVLEVSNMDLLIDFAQIGMGIGYVIKNFIETELKEGSLIELPVPVPQINRSFGITYNIDATLTEAMGIFINTFQEAHTKIEETSK